MRCLADAGGHGQSWTVCFRAPATCSGYLAPWSSLPAPAHTHARIRSCALARCHPTLRPTLAHTRARVPAPVHVLSSTSVPKLVPALVHALTHVVVLVPIVFVPTFVPALMPAPVPAVLFALMPRSCPCLCLHAYVSQLCCPHVSLLVTAVPSFEFIHLRQCPFSFMVIRVPLHVLVHLCLPLSAQELFTWIRLSAVGCLGSDAIV